MLKSVAANTGPGGGARKSRADKKKQERPLQQCKRPFFYSSNQTRTMKIIAIDETEKFGFTMIVETAKGFKTQMPIPMETYLALVELRVKDRSAISEQFADIVNRYKASPLNAKP